MKKYMAKIVSTEYGTRFATFDSLLAAKQWATHNGLSNNCNSAVIFLRDAEFVKVCDPDWVKKVSARHIELFYPDIVCSRNFSSYKKGWTA